MIPHIPRHIASALAVLTALSCMAIPAILQAAPGTSIESKTDPDAIYAEADKAFKAGDFKKAAKATARGIEICREARFLYLRALSVLKLGEYEESWSLMNLVKPNELPIEQQDPFVADYERIEIEAKTAKEHKAATAQAMRRKVSPIQPTNKLPIFLMVGGGAGVLAGGVFMAFGVKTAQEVNDQAERDMNTHANYHDRYGSARIWYWTGAGLIAAGTVFIGWGALELFTADDEVASAWLPEVRPETWASQRSDDLLNGVSLSWKF